jgi:hypothetical protein
MAVVFRGVTLDGAVTDLRVEDGRITHLGAAPVAQIGRAHV